MPKDKRLNSLSLDRATASPYSRGSKKSADPEIDISNEEKQWNDTVCPICMDHPHNAVLLLCSSHKTGCRPFVCDTSYRHSNCLDQLLLTKTRHLSCPLCRGPVSGFRVVGPARHLMNSKPRNCSLETCDFAGTYADLRKHARAQHPSARPLEPSQARKADWSELEQRLEMEDAAALVYQSDNNMEFEPELWDDDRLFDFPEIEDGLMEEMFGDGWLSFLSTSSSYTEEEEEEDVVDSGTSVSRSNREIDVRSRSRYDRGSGSRARRENENLRRSSYGEEYRQEQQPSWGGYSVRTGSPVRSGRRSSSSSRRHLSGSSSRRQSRSGRGE
ncbi:hypothetical protein STAS_03138 [Striga asiatica]|uniref:Uncharacterized protein n=1 Tax=Striga asiatica TaxID=4170 RepID=A0A5A7P3V7_STRAF|nr:hypothetical protein STAS_03138 [Striga asiatica]